MMRSCLSVQSFLALALVSLLSVAPASAQIANPCAVALHQQLQSIVKAQIQLNDAYIQLQAQRTIALNKCPSSGSANQQCVADVESEFTPLRKRLDDQGTLLNAEAARANNDFNPGNCLWSAQEITQMVATLGQVTSQITQSIAQVISAAKGNGAAGGKAGQASQPTQTPPPSQASRPTKTSPPTQPPQKPTSASVPPSKSP